MALRRARYDGQANATPAPATIAIATAAHCHRAGLRTTARWVPVSEAAIALAKAVPLGEPIGGAPAEGSGDQASSDSGMSRSTPTDGAGPANRLAMTDCGVVPVNGGSPVSISKRTQPRL